MFSTLPIRPALGPQEVRSPEGAGLGMSFEQVKGIYGARRTMRTGSVGTPGFLIADGDKVMVFGGHPIRDGIGWLAVGMADHTEHTFLTDATC